MSKKIASILYVREVPSEVIAGIDRYAAKVAAEGANASRAAATIALLRKALVTLGMMK